MRPGEKNLNTYRILFIVYGCLMFLGTFLGLIYASLGSFIGGIVEDDMTRQGADLPINPATFIMAIGIGITIFTAVMGILGIMASVRIKQRRSRKFIIVVAAITCLSGLLGILLCIFTIIELQKPEVKAVFAENDG